MMMQRQPAPAMGVVPQQHMGGNPMAAMMVQQPSQQPAMVVADPMAVANAAASALDAALGGPPGAMPPPPAASVERSRPVLVDASRTAAPNAPTRILILLNMVMDEDFETDDEFRMLEEEVKEEASKYGKLISIKIPKPQVCMFVFASCFFV